MYRKQFKARRWTNIKERKYQKKTNYLSTAKNIVGWIGFGLQVFGTINKIRKVFKS